MIDAEKSYGQAIALEKFMTDTILEMKDSAESIVVKIPSLGVFAKTHYEHASEPKPYRTIEINSKNRALFATLGEEHFIDFSYCNFYNHYKSFKVTPLIMRMLTTNLDKIYRTSFYAATEIMARKIEEHGSAALNDLVEEHRLDYTSTRKSSLEDLMDRLRKMPIATTQGIIYPS